MTKEIQDTSEVEGKNTESTEGAVDTAATETDKQENKEETKHEESREDRRFNQADVDAIVKRAKADAKAAAKRDYDKSIEGKRIFSEDELATHVQEAIQTAVESALKERELETVKAALKDEYSLSDLQVARLSGDDEKALRADADLLFGAMKTKKAPNLIPGGNEERARSEEEDAIAAGLTAALNQTSKRR